MSDNTFELEPEFVPKHKSRPPVGSVTTFKGGFDYKPCYECQRNRIPSLRFFFNLTGGRTRQGYICFECSQKLNNPVYRNLARSGLVFTPVGDFLSRQAGRVVAQKRLPRVIPEEANWTPFPWQIWEGTVPIHQEVAFTRPNTITQILELIYAYTGDTYPEPYVENVLRALSEGKRPPLVTLRDSQGEIRYLARSQTTNRKKKNSHGTSQKSN